MKDCVILSSKPAHEAMAVSLAKETGRKFHFIYRPEDLTRDRLALIGPEYVFVPHWSHIIPAEIHRNFECVIFHMTDLPYGRGGSPLQNLVVRGHEKTKISALRCSDGLDDGPVYLKEDLSLEGTAGEILGRAAEIIYGMILVILRDRPVPQPQTGEPTLFKRRKPAESDISGLAETGKIFDYIRMLDAPGYPHAFIEAGGVRIEFTGAQWVNGELTAVAKFKKRDTK